MNSVYIRVAFFFVAPLLGMLPGVDYDGGKLITIDIEVASVGLGLALAAVSGVFAKWGKK